MNPFWPKNTLVSLILPLIKNQQYIPSQGHDSVNTAYINFKVHLIIEQPKFCLLDGGLPLRFTAAHKHNKHHLKT